MKPPVFASDVIAKPSLSLQEVLLCQGFSYPPLVEPGVYVKPKGTKKSPDAETSCIRGSRVYSVQFNASVPQPPSRASKLHAEAEPDATITRCVAAGRTIREPVGGIRIAGAAGESLHSTVVQDVSRPGIGKLGLVCRRNRFEVLERCRGSRG